MATLIRPRKKKAPDYWAIQYTEHGRRRYHTLGRMSRKEAEQRLREFEARQTLGIDAEQEQKPGEMTMDAFVTEHFAPVLADKAPATQKAEMRAIGHLRRVWPGIVLTAITSDKVEDYKVQRRREKARARTINGELCTLRNILNLAEMRGLLHKGMPRIRRAPLLDTRPPRYLTREEAGRLQRHLIERFGKRGYGYPSAMAILVGLHTGMRSGEVLSREWTDVSWDAGHHGTIRVGHKPEIGWKPKTRKERTVPMTERLSVELRRYWTWLGKPVKGWLFRSGTCQGFTYRVAVTAREVALGRHMTTAEIASSMLALREEYTGVTPWKVFVGAVLRKYKKRGMLVHADHAVWMGRPGWISDEGQRMESFSRGLRLSCARAGVPILNQHALRHTWASLAFEDGLDLKVVQEIGGWSTARIPLEIYGHVSSQHALSAVQGFSLGKVGQGDVIPLAKRKKR